jgi:hypothetical protein
MGKIRYDIFRTLTGLVMGLAACGPAFAQDDRPPVLPAPQLPAPNATIPEQTYPCNPGSYEPAPGEEKPELPYAYDCEGVIDPPEGVDPDIKVAPPETAAGTMPVIPPSAVPETE